MGIKDNFTVLFGSGIDYAGKKAEEIKLQADLTKTNASIESAYAALGRAVMGEESANQSFLAVYGPQVKAVHELERHAAEIRARIDELSRAQATSVAAPQTFPSTTPVGQCPRCGSLVSVSSMLCPSCGDNLAALKAAYTKCPSCGAFYDSSTVFCVDCGARVEPLPVSESALASFATQPSASAMPESSAMPAPPAPVSFAQPQSISEQPALMTCPGCGEPVGDGDLFCGGCGTRLK